MAISNSYLRNFSDEELQTYILKYARDKCVIIKDALNKNAIEQCMQIQFSEPLDSIQFFRMHNDKDSDAIIESIFKALHPFYEKITNRPLYPTYGFAMKYVEGCELFPHYDRYENSISSTICYFDNVSESPWPILIDKETFHNPFSSRITVFDPDGIPEEHIIPCNLKAGDIAIFDGLRHLHWRRKLDHPRDYRGILFHFTDYLNHDGSLSKAERSVYGITDEMQNFHSYSDFRDRYARYYY